MRSLVSEARLVNCFTSRSNQYLYSCGDLRRTQAASLDSITEQVQESDTFESSLDIPVGAGDREAKGREEGGPLFIVVDSDSACLDGTKFIQQPKLSEYR